MSEAQSYVEEKLSQEHGTTKKQVRYSFVKEFKAQEEKFEKDFNGIPKRFFNTDLRDKFVPSNATDDELIKGTRAFNMRELNLRLINSLSQPSDNKISSDEAVKLLQDEEFKNIVEITDANLLKTLKSNRAWKATLDDKDTIVIDGNAGTKLSSRYAFRTNSEYFSAYQYWNKLDLRKVAGNKRVKEKTEVNVLENSIRTQKVIEAERYYSERIHDMTEEINANKNLSEEDKKILIQEFSRSNFQKAQSIDALQRLEDAQFEGKNFIAQKKYIKEHSGSVATAYEDKKNPDKIRQDMMKNTRLNKYFRKVEIDNDVDPAEFAQFEKDYEDVMNKLPKIPKGREPELRIRKLGKHKANGIYFPHKNTVSIDVRTSGSFVHEMAHQYDFAIKGNASLRDDFREITNDYSKSLKVPATEPSSRLEYLNTPTEVLARGFECYAHQKLGINNKLIDVSKFDNYDHEPFKNPKLKEKVFAFFDKLYDEDSKEK